ncbi:MAG: hypothetical protein AB1753_04760 [Thermoproteota archaeon]
MAVARVKKAARQASVKEARVLKSLETYYKGECSLGYTADKLKMPLRALIEFMIKHDLPQYWQEEDRIRGLKKLSEIRSIA